MSIIYALVALAAATVIFMIGRVGGAARREKERRSAVATEIAASRRSIERLRARLNSPAHDLPSCKVAWSCRTPRHAVAEVREAIGACTALLDKATRLLPISVESAAKLRAEADERLARADTLLDFTEKWVIPLIGRFREQAVRLFDLTAERRANLERRLRAGGDPDNPLLRRTAMLGNVIEACRSTVAAAPVTTMRLLNTQQGFLNSLDEGVDPKTDAAAVAPPERH